MLLREVSPAKLGHEAQGHIIGVTGPPGAGKSTLLSALLHAWRGTGGPPARTVAVLAVDPSSRRSGGALLGDRARIEFDPTDRGVFIRSTQAANSRCSRCCVVEPGIRPARAIAASHSERE